MLESAGMVLVQALKELKRTSEIFVQLEETFGSVAYVPVKVFLTGATMQMATESVSDLRPIFEEYIAKWRYTNDEVYVLNREQDSSSNGLAVISVMSTEQYFEVAELYTVTFLSIVSQEIETAISWAEKAELVEKDRQGLLKKLQALQSAANKKPSTVKQITERTVYQHASSLRRAFFDALQLAFSVQMNPLAAGPSHAVVVIDPVSFEVQLKVKGKTEHSKDKTIVVDAFTSQHAQPQ
ncbi:hypothetical protein PR202_gb02800 [Eleusine coracana subsp. coracana]|uniref:Uncharacterized protein n=1 Tax=Eleusine coracana subsp. coracana TaxID=191504 RepID=A0AAV5E010_ELECO|nr:hypothetical protein PR202_gb02800 [Eleusine coracana subsp. coracana]